ncbi:MAG: hypothetical protein B7Z08_13030 [Sphingomonadales bacterium 32-68-7]|nr:MAG: hypothetical protein B7Z08_13030 [Sphingomonadales bacterium 32-68-7]
MKCSAITSLVLAVMVSGCAGWNKGAPSCDGSAKRPLNRSLWDWEANPPAAPKPDLPPVKRLGQVQPVVSIDGLAQVSAAWSAFDVARSFRLCSEATRHG